jgi:hypothetical protein
MVCLPFCGRIDAIRDKTTWDKAKSKAAEAASATLNFVPETSLN